MSRYKVFLAVYCNTIGLPLHTSLRTECVLCGETVIRERACSSALCHGPGGHHSIYIVGNLHVIACRACRRGCHDDHDDTTRKLLPWNLSLSAVPRGARSGGVIGPSLSTSARHAWREQLSVSSVTADTPDTTYARGVMWTALYLHSQIGRVTYTYLCYFCFRWKTVSLVQALMQHLMHHVTVGLQQSKITLQNNCINNTSITQPTLSFYLWLKM